MIPPRREARREVQEQTLQNRDSAMVGPRVLRNRRNETQRHCGREDGMKNAICFWVATGFLALGVATHGADGLTQTLQHGLYEEEANQNLDAAIKAYQSVI